MAILHSRNIPLEFLSITLSSECPAATYFLKSRIFVLHCSSEADYECCVLNENYKLCLSQSVRIGKLTLCPVPISVILLH